MYIKHIYALCTLFLSEKDLESASAKKLKADTRMVGFHISSQSTGNGEFTNLYDISISQKMSVHGIITTNPYIWWIFKHMQIQYNPADYAIKLSWNTWLQNHLQSTIDTIASTSI